METLHAADVLRRTWDGADGGGEPLAGGAVVVGGDRIVAVGTFEELRVRFPGARVRKWSGVLGPGRVHEGPLPDAPSPRERIHAVLKLGAVAVLDAYVADEPGLRAAAARVGVVVLPDSSAARRPAIAGTGGRADLAVFDADGRCVATVCAGRLVHRRA
ncbi:imidazolonepropionase-like domain-containing protein [Streptomyces sp. NPDC087851]|uniref:imidazolonepropionase-like domain-containing protein n=1 Tax=Streptomyces sp. NPDC087851 TaxID=3365810 RepID=UPI0037F7F622